MDIVSTTLRTTVGALFVGHGAQKLFGWFGGPGPDATGEAFESMGLAPGKRNAIAAGAAEAGGGLLLASGRATPLAAATLTGTMVTAIRHAHLKQGPWAQDGGYEYPLVLALAVTAIAEERTTTWKALGGLALGIAGSVAVSELGKRFAAASEPTDDEIPGPVSAAAVADAELTDPELAAAPTADPTDRLVAREEAAAAAEAGAVGGPTPPRAGSDPAMRPVDEAGGGEAEGFELAEEDLIANATHDDGHGAPLLDRIDEESADPLLDPEYGEADEAHVRDA